MHVALAGGVGGAKLALGLSRVLSPEELTVVVNTGDDFDHLGMRICPDLDTVMYTLAGMANPETGWGVRDETWTFMDSLARQGGETWFRIGDRDLQTHITRTARLAEGASLSAVTAELCAALGVAHPVLPATDDRVATMVRVADGLLAFQDYFVRLQCAPRVEGFDFVGAETARPTAAVADAFASGRVDSVIVCPSNPFVSIGPMLAIPALRDCLAERTFPCVAVSPIVGGAALKGPAAKMMVELGIGPSPVAVADCYAGLIDGLVIDEADAEDADELSDSGIAVLVTGTVMRSDGDRERLASETLAFASGL